jgi:hypothetical protein
MYMLLVIAKLVAEAKLKMTLLTHKQTVLSITGAEQAECPNTTSYILSQIPPLIAEPSLNRYRL